MRVRVGGRQQETALVVCFGLQRKPPAQAVMQGPHHSGSGGRFAHAGRHSRAGIPPRHPRRSQRAVRVPKGGCSVRDRRRPFVRARRGERAMSWGALSPAILVHLYTCTLAPFVALWKRCERDPRGKQGMTKRQTTSMIDGVSPTIRLGTCWSGA